MKPSRGTVSVKIKDNKQNTISQHLSQQLNRGVFSSQLQLSDEPPLGQWMIQVQSAAGSQKSKTFAVEEYVLPKFEVELQTKPSEKALVTSSVTAKIKARYTFGKPLQGQAKVRAAPAYYRNFFPQPMFDVGPEPFGRRPGRVRPNAAKPLEKMVPLDRTGEAEVIFTNPELRKQHLIPAHGGQLNISVSVTEKLTGEKNDAFEMVQLVKYPLRFNFDQPSQYFKPGIDYTLKMSLVTYSDKPLPKHYPRTVYLNITYDFGRNTPPESAVQAVKDRYGNYRLVAAQSVTLDSSGSADIRINPSENCSYVNLHAEYYYIQSDARSKIESRASVQSSQSPTDNYLSVGLLENSLSAGQKARVTVQATEPIGSVDALVISRGKIRARISEYSIPGTSGVIQFRTTPDMAPSAKIIVYKMRTENFEIIADAIQLKIDAAASGNPVNVFVSPARARPGDPVQVTVLSEPNSFVGLLGVDKSVKLLKSGNDITQEMVEREIQSYANVGGFYGRQPIMFRRRKRSIIPPFWGGGPYAKSVFQVLL